MKLAVKLSAFICMVLLGGFNMQNENRLSAVIEPLHAYVEQVLSNMNEIPEERKEVLEQIAEDVSDQIKAGHQSSSKRRRKNGLG